MQIAIGDFGAIPACLVYPQAESHRYWICSFRHADGHVPVGDDGKGNRRREEMVTNSKGNALLEGYERRFRLGDRSIYSTLNQPESRCHRVFSSRCDPTAFPGLRKGDL